MRHKFAAALRIRYFLASILAAAVLIAMLSSPGVASAQKKKKNQSPDVVSDPPGQTSTPPTALNLPIPQAVDQVIGQMLGAFQLGDLEAMHKCYADNATFVSGTYGPPVVGWQNYVPLYQKGLQGFQGIQIIRRNTYIFNIGNVAWAMYQWEFLSTYQGRPYSAQGQTTLILNKVGDNWLIVHNHTSQVLSQPSPVLPAATPQQPGQSVQPSATPNR